MTLAILFLRKKSRDVKKDSVASRLKPLSKCHIAVSRTEFNGNSARVA